MAKIMVVAGEASGDMHAAWVIEELRKLSPEVEVFGMGSEALREQGVEIIVDPTDVDSIGFTSAGKNIRVHLSHLRRMKEIIADRSPDLLFLVDYSGFNMLMARVAAKSKIPAVSYFPPTAWIWGQWRARWMSRYGATIAAVFPPEREVYLRAGAEVCFVGHPLLDMVGVNKEAEQIFSQLELDPEKKVIGLLPGSRPGEIKRHLPVMLEAAERLQKENKRLQFVLPLVPEFDREKASSMVGRYKLILKIIRNYTYEVMKISDLIITASGTATVEAMIMGTPMIIIYQTSPLNYKVGKFLLNVDHIGMPNILARKEIVPEFIQEEVSSRTIYRKTKDLIYKPYLLKDIKKNLAWVKKMLGDKGAIRRTARLLLRKGDIDYGG